MSKQEKQVLGVDCVRELARLQRHFYVDEEMAARIAVGASNAVRALRVSLEEVMFDSDPSDFLAELHRLAKRAP